MNSLVFNIHTIKLAIYFLPELFSFFGIILNILLMPFIIQNLKLKIASNIITSTIFCINSIILSVLIFLHKIFSVKNDLFVFNNETLSLKLFINIFAIFFVLVTYKYTRKSQFRLPIVNSILILIIMLSGMLLSSDNFTFIYVLLEVIIILIYKYASNMRRVKNTTYSSVYIAISFCATVLFVIFYCMDYIVHDLLQKSIMQSCIVLALLLKIGLFPIFNYSIDKKCRSNISYSMLLFCLLPFVGAVMFSKIISQCMFNEVCQLSAGLFILLCAATSSLSLYKSKNLTLFLTNSTQIYVCFYILNLLFVKDLNSEFMFITTSIFFILYSMLRIYKNNKKYTLIFSLLLVLAAFIIPIFGLNMLFNIYTFDKAGFLVLNIFAFCNILLIIKTLGLIESFYKTKPI